MAMAFGAATLLILLASGALVLTLRNEQSKLREQLARRQEEVLKHELSLSTMDEERRRAVDLRKNEIDRAKSLEDGFALAKRSWEEEQAELLAEQSRLQDELMRIGEEKDKLASRAVTPASRSSLPLSTFTNPWIRVETIFDANPDVMNSLRDLIPDDDVRVAISNAMYARSLPIQTNGYTISLRGEVAGVRPSQVATDRVPVRVSVQLTQPFVSYDLQSIAWATVLDESDVLLVPNDLTAAEPIRKRVNELTARLLQRCLIPPSAAPQPAGPPSAPINPTPPSP